MFQIDILDLMASQPILDCYYLEYPDYWPSSLLLNSQCFDQYGLSAFFRCFMSNSGINMKSQNEPFIWTTGVDCSNSVNPDWVQVLSYSKDSLLFLPIVGIEPATSRWFHSEALSNLIHYAMYLHQTIQN